ncbi:MAG TPA: pyridoxal-phosphate dependent enzyme [Candidatus Limnocylindrales bacterium]|nr:pyridoxal-phosphate dependent enzyme [Candidatus Limnocylindrales bacterium]
MSALPGVRRPPGDPSAHLAEIPTSFACDGCGYLAPSTAPAPQRCPAALPGDDIDHVLRRVLDTDRVGFPATSADDGTSPFEAYRELFHAWHVGRAIGWSDADYVALVRDLDGRVAEIEGHGFQPTPLLRAATLADRLGLRGALLVKDETVNVGGSHKARHLMGTVLELELAAQLDGSAHAPVRPLAIASCGNAALAAAIVAAAWGRPLLVFVPTDADPSILARLRDLRATVSTVPRDPAVPGDPTYLAMRQAIAAGALPFTCQGPDNGFAIEGGHTLGYELTAQLAAASTPLDRLFIQVGGGALAASVAAGLAEAEALGVLTRLPRIHAVQSHNVQPLARAYRAVVAEIAPHVGVGAEPPAAEAPASAWQSAADRLRDAILDQHGRDPLASLPRHRSAFMRPWDGQAGSVAGGIVDDETYDWFAVVRAMLLTGGFPVTADEATLLRAAELGRETTGIDANPTGTAGLAGLITLLDAGGVDPAENVGLLFTGIRRTAAHGEPS